MIELGAFASVMAVVTGPLAAGVEGRGYGVAAVQNGASAHELRVFIENGLLGFCVATDWEIVSIAAYPAVERAAWNRWSITPDAFARWRGEPPPADQAGAETVARFVARVGELEALARDIGRWQDVRRGRLPR
ncbi:hypothetical protein QQX13_04780 [Demequina sp. SYSU T00068]|uniref:hypothetical protein n=1 Tax=Demequina lignilytica TaxID=3051663 RepID=UPI002605271A|nr:hypothetical protein [Demequina sp. SYSU T00068]MDN4490139.1 hypothetical protein [Demequina sp. SYSU T00068]